MEIENEKYTTAKKQDESPHRRQCVPPGSGSLEVVTTPTVPTIPACDACHRLVPCGLLLPFLFLAAVLRVRLDGPRRGPIRAQSVRGRVPATRGREEQWSDSVATRRNVGASGRPTQRDGQGRSTGYCLAARKHVHFTGKAAFQRLWILTS